MNDFIRAGKVVFNKTEVLYVIKKDEEIAIRFNSDTHLYIRANTSDELDENYKTIIDQLSPEQLLGEMKK